MYNGKRVKSGSTKHFRRSLALAASLVLLMSLGIGATLAWLTDTTKDVENVFTPAAVPPEIEETKPEDNDNVKENVKVKNQGNVSAYIRAAIVVTWQDDNGNVAPELPVLNTDYTMTLATGTNWSQKQADGYYYYLEPVAAQGTTDVLIDEAEPIAPNGDYHLVVEILTQTIQSEGVDSKGNKPIELAWGVDIENGQLKSATITE